MAMEKLFHFDSPREVYKADACVITCFDARFDLPVRKFLKRWGVVTFDHVKIPGGAKSLAAPECDTDRDLVLRMVRTSMRLHGSERVLIVAHRECGAYPGASVDAVMADAMRAAELLRASEPTLGVECYFADFDGVYGMTAAG
jgi:carbonic anhydrase